MLRIPIKRLRGDIMWQKDHRKSKKACVPRSAFEEEPEYYSFNDNYDYGDVDYEEDNEQFFTFFIHFRLSNYYF